MGRLKHSKMPIPKPSPGESQNDFISRCLGSEVMKREFPDLKQRQGICFSQFRKKNLQEDKTEIEEALAFPEIREGKDPSGLLDQGVRDILEEEN